MSPTSARVSSRSEAVTLGKPERPGIATGAELVAAQHRLPHSDRYPSESARPPHRSDAHDRNSRPRLRTDTGRDASATIVRNAFQQIGEPKRERDLKACLPRLKWPVQKVRNSRSPILDGADMDVTATGDAL